MDKKSAIIIVLVIIAIILFGQRSEHHELEDIQSPDFGSAPLTSPTSADAGQVQQPIILPDGRVDLYQGVEVHLDSINWRGREFNAQRDNGIVEAGGLNDFKVNKIIFDPDVVNRGYPSLVVTASNPQIFDLGKFVNETLGAYQFSPAIARLLSKQGPYETHNWDIRDKDGKKTGQAQMDIWLMEFNVVIDAKPSSDKTLTPADSTKIDPITGLKNSDLKAEYENQRYGNLDIVLKLTAGQQAPILASHDGQRTRVSKKPHFGIAALEVASVKFLGSKDKQTGEIGAYLEKGESLALFDKPTFDYSEPTKKVNYIDPNSIKDIEQYRSQLMNKNLGSVDWSSSIFDKDKYAYIHVANFGSWKEKQHFYSSSELWADKIDVRFVMHIFAIGDWELKRPVVIGQIDATERNVKHESGIFEFKMPGFGLGAFGQYLTGSTLLIAGILVLGVFFPPVLTIINTILGAISGVLKRLLASKT